MLVIHCTLQKVPSEFVVNFLSYLANKQTDRQTDGQIKHILLGGSNEMQEQLPMIAGTSVTYCHSWVSQYKNAKPSWIVPKHEMMMAVVTIRTLRAGCTNAQLTVWLANRWLTLTAQLTRCRVVRSTVN